MKGIDLFAGAGGWDVAALDLGIILLGIENNASALATRAAAGLHTFAGDLETLFPYDVCKSTDILVASPPCQSFSNAGKRAGLDDPRGQLVYVPMWWVWWLQPTYIAFEQVPPVLPFWEEAARELRLYGYSTWTGILCAEQYGVPQTRKRAILMARRDGAKCEKPKATHSRYYPREPGRLDYGLLPWVSMAQALGWDGAVATRGDRAEGLSTCVYEHGRRAPVLTEKARSWALRPSYTVQGGGGETGGAEPFSNAARRASGMASGTRPAPTIVGTPRADDGIVVGRQLAAGEGRNVGGWGWLKNGSNENAAVRAVETPAPTMFFAERQRTVEWFEGRPATSIVGSFSPDLVTPAGHRTWDATTSRQDGGVRVTTREAAILQSFPEDYPWQGAKTHQFQQIGNAIPPGLARAILRALTTHERP